MNNPYSTQCYNINSYEIILIQYTLQYLIADSAYIYIGKYIRV